jgi:hypothetical protein
LGDALVGGFGLGALGGDEALDGDEGLLSGLLDEDKLLTVDMEDTGDLSNV